MGGPRVAVTPRSLSGGEHPSLERLRRAGFELVYPSPGRVPSADELLAVVPGCVAYLAGTETIGRELIAASPHLTVIARNGVGVDNVDLDAAAQYGVRVDAAPGANAQGVAELAIALLFASVRSLPRHDAGVTAGGWPRRVGIELAGRTLGIVGLGQIGQRVTRMALGIGLEVVGYDAYPSPTFDPGDGFRWATLEQTVSAAHAVSLHAPGGSIPIIDTELLSTMREGAFLINTARASLVDDAAVLEALESGALAGFATDVYEQEPPRLNALIEHPRCISTPHIGGYTVESIERATDAAIDNILAGVASPQNEAAAGTDAVAARAINTL